MSEEIEEQQPEPVCPVCGKPIPRDESVLRENGAVLHARCWKPPHDADGRGNDHEVSAA